MTFFSRIFSKTCFSSPYGAPLSATSRADIKTNIHSTTTTHVATAMTIFSRVFLAHLWGMLHSSTCDSPKSITECSSLHCWSVCTDSNHLWALKTLIWFTAGCGCFPFLSCWANHPVGFPPSLTTCQPSCWCWLKDSIQWSSRFQDNFRDDWRHRIWLYRRQKQPCVVSMADLSCILWWWSFTVVSLFFVLNFILTLVLLVWTTVWKWMGETIVDNQFHPTAFSCILEMRLKHPKDDGSRTAHSQCLKTLCCYSGGQDQSWSIHCYVCQIRVEFAGHLQSSGNEGARIGSFCLM